VSGMAFRPRSRSKQVQLNITPLIDVLFLLIIFFMLTGTFKRVGELELHLPESSTAQPTPGETETRQIELVVTETGGILLDGEPTEMSRLKEGLARILASDPRARIMIKAESGVQHGEVVRILDLVRETGFPGVGIGTHIQPGKAPR
jgi:biopolymer transport protein ExbD